MKSRWALLAVPCVVVTLYAVFHEARTAEPCPQQVPCAVDDKRPAAAGSAPQRPAEAGGTPAAEYHVVLEFEDGASIAFAPGVVGRVIAVRWGGGQEANPCPVLHFGKEEATRHCYAEPIKCTRLWDVTDKPLLLTTAKRLAAGQSVVADKATFGEGPCPGNHQVLELEVAVTARPPLYTTLRHCSGNAYAVTFGLKGSGGGWAPNCACKPGFAGAACDRCGVGYTWYPRCIADPYSPAVVVRAGKRAPGGKQAKANAAPDAAHGGAAECPAKLPELSCDLSQYPRALLQKQSNPNYMNVMGCNVASLPWGCELGTRTTQIESVCTLVTGEFVGAHLLILFESLRVFAPETPFYIGIDVHTRQKHEPLLAKLQNRGLHVEIIPLRKTPGLPFWFHEKPNLMQQVLERHRTTLWLDADVFLVGPLPLMPDAAAATFGVGMHDPRGWGTGYMAQLQGYANTGVVYAARGSPLLKAWVDSMLRFEHSTQDIAYYQGMPSMYLDQGPVDVAITTQKGAFKLEPQWNVGWWTPDLRLEKQSRPNWWQAGDFAEERLALGAGGNSLLLDGAPVVAVHSHFVSQEKAYGKMDLPFNTLVYDLLQQAPEGSLLRKFAPRLARYATHVEHPSEDVVRPRKDTPEFIDTIKDDWPGYSTFKSDW
ncbi:hypothetical protein DIPPA_17694 [Diplonema papillatum]|nr:hypothetical protein DIPPA_17694 [Diplonema papillatum]